MTREYVELPPLRTHAHSRTFGFGVSKLTGQYKIVCGDKFGSYYVYTLGGEDLWRNIEATPPRGNKRTIVPRDFTAFYKGLSQYDFKKNLHRCCFHKLRAPGDYAIFFS